MFINRESHKPYTSGKSKRVSRTKHVLLLWVAISSAQLYFLINSMFTKKLEHNIKMNIVIFSLDFLTSALQYRNYRKVKAKAKATLSPRRSPFLLFRDMEPLNTSLPLEFFVL